MFRFVDSVLKKGSFQFKTLIIGSFTLHKTTKLDVYNQLELLVKLPFDEKYHVHFDDIHSESTDKARTTPYDALTVHFPHY